MFHVRNVPICNFLHRNAREYPYKMDTSCTDLPLQMDTSPRKILHKF
nr:MAG TPA: hypothetical protein [Caudoviricetes sp.]